MNHNHDKKENVLAIVNSNKRLNPTRSNSSNFNYSFSDNVDRIEEIVVKNVQIPYSFYIFRSATKNVLTFNNNTTSITIPPNNYTIATLTTTLTDLINTAFGDTTTVVLFSTNTEKLTINRGTLFKVDAIVDQPASTAASLLGFTQSSITALSITADSYYNIMGNVFNTTNVLKFNGGTTTAIIPDGNYNTNTLPSVLKTAIDTAFGDTNTTVQYSNTTYKLTITRGSSFIINTESDLFTSTASTILGFTKTTASSSTAVGDSILNITGPNYICIRSRFLTKAANRKTVYADNTYTNILSIIPMVIGTGDIVSIPDPDLIGTRLSYKFKISTTDIIDIIITDDTGAVLDLNGFPISFQIVFKTD